jgi:DtxR family transcriptional regulator, Mn-dependent transcriptional regulator
LTAHGLIDTTEMYLRTVFELEEEGIVPLRARIVERLAQSGPTVSQTVARMERDGLLHVENDKQLALSEAGRTLATRVMRKHRLAECLLTDVIKLPWEEVHIEACRWEHVISESVERRVFEMLGYPVVCPHGNLIPGLTELGLPDKVRERVLAAEQWAATHEAGEPMTKVAERLSADGGHVFVRRISEQIQSDLDLMLKLRRAGIQPGREVILMGGEHGVRVTTVDSMDTASIATGPITAGPMPAVPISAVPMVARPVELADQIASHVFVAPVPPAERAHDGLG